MIVLQTFYPAEQQSLMTVALWCLDFMSLGIVFLLYVLHVILWVTSSTYRHQHDSSDVSGVASTSFSEKLVR